ncbi:MULTISPECIES: hypothetical protein [Actinoplanes]|uniref:hypothetical protein n=1 Tax=Actinoplanes TaxID=1865 RepID=UPI000696ECC7|nr:MULTISPECIES: hypothetical protein [Actinoplanes]GLY04933.1 hypothetical protein Acsp01_53120 [Actinoplanes sp. NBRC 101535]
MSPRTRRIPLTVGVLLLSAACGAPPEPLPTAPSLPHGSGAPVAVPSIVIPPPATVPTAALPTVAPTYTTYTPYPTYPTYTVVPTPTTTAPLSKSPTPTPAHAAACTGQPTGAEILALIADDPGVPDRELEVAEGPFCSGDWSFTTVRIAGSATSVEPLMVATTGKGTTLALVAAGTDVCNPRMQAEAPSGIRVLACGF